MPTAYITAPPDAAADLAAGLVEERLAACVNRVPCESTYRWEGEVHHDAEVVLFAKTTAGAYGRLVSYVREHHPHEVPCIERLEEDHVDRPFLEWRNDVVDDRD